METPKVTFGIIVLNGEPFTRYNLTALYPFAHEIIVVEGACPSAKDFSTPSGHSQDGTLEILRQYQREQDPDRKIQIVTAEEDGHTDGFWTEKDEMSQAYARRATGQYLWQVDMDEFYRAEDMRRVFQMLAENPTITAGTFQVITFWGGLESCTDGIFLRREAQNFHRLFAWGPGYHYQSHRPPTVLNERREELRTLAALSGAEMARQGIFLYHYSFLFPFQANFKLAYYGNMDQSQNIPLQMQRRKWHGNYFSLADPFYIDDTSILGEPSWLVRFRKKHPKAILTLWDDIVAGKISVERRPTHDIDRLLNAPWYSLAKAVLPVVWQWLYRMRSGLRRVRRLALRQVP